MSSWEEKWSVVKTLPGGGQGEAFIVARTGTSEPQYFMKVLRDRRLERKNAMRREIACYATLQHQLIPRLIDSNIASFDENVATPYLVTDFVVGTLLSSYVQKRGLLSASEAIQMT